jgi:hypothetical protein
MISTTVYDRTLQQRLGTDELNQLLATSRTNNARARISGMLTVRRRDVMQVLEGDANDVRDLYARISRDPRHGNVITVWTSTHQDRRFPNWSMVSTTSEPNHRPRLLRNGRNQTSRS